MLWKRKTIFAPSGQLGFTFVELMLGILLTSLVMSALATFCLALAGSWKQSESAQELVMNSSQTNRLLQRELKRVKAIGVTRAGSTDPASNAAAACAMLWLEDANSDGQIQFGEMGLLEHNKTSRTIDLLTVRFPSNWTQPAIDTYNVTTTESEWSDTAAPENFKAWRAVIDATVSPVRLARNVDALRLSLPTGGVGTRPVIEYTLLLSGATASAVEGTEYGSVSLRGPQEPQFP